MIGAKSLFRWLDNDTPAEQLLSDLARAEAQAEAARRAQFEPLGVDREHPCPASVVYHAHSRLAHDSELPLDARQVCELTLNRDDKRYEGAPRVALATQQAPLHRRLDELTSRRRSTHSFAAAPITFTQLSTLLALSLGVTDPNHQPPLRACPSAGALYPIEAYCLAFAVEGLEPSLYHYDAQGHALERVRDTSGPRELWPALFQRLWGVEPAVVVLLSARLARVQAKYAERGYRFALLECGHIAQALLTSAAAMELASLPIGGFVDDELGRLLGIDGMNEVALYVVCIGHEIQRDS